MKDITEQTKKRTTFFTTVKDVHFRCQVKLEMLTNIYF